MKSRLAIENLRRVLTPNVLKLGLISLFADIASEMLYPITPIFLTHVLGASFTSVGAIEGVAEGIASLLKSISGRWSDRLQNRKSFVVAGYALSAIAKPLLGLSNSWTQVMAIRSMDRVGKGLRSAPRDALLSDSAPIELQGAAFGWHRAMDTLGAAIGPLLSLAFITSFATAPKAPETSLSPELTTTLRSLFLWSLVPGAIAVIISLFVHESRSASSTARKLSESKSPIDDASSALSPQFKRYLIAWTAFSLTNSSDVFLLLRAQNAGVSLANTILLYTGYNLVYALSSPYLGHLSDKIPRKHVLMTGLTVFATVYLLFGFATEGWHFLLLFLVYGLYIGATDGVGKAFAVDLLPINQKATGLGALGTATGLSMIAASTAGGWLWDHFGPRATFLYGAAGALTAIALLSASRFDEAS